MNDLKVIFDLDGVLVSERPYWSIADATARDLLEELNVQSFTLDVAEGIGVVPFALIDELKIRGVNSNWDLTHLILTSALAIGFAKQREPKFLADSIESLNRGLFEGWSAWGKQWSSGEWTLQELTSLLDRFWRALGAHQGYAVLENWTSFLAAECAGLSALWHSLPFRAYHQQKFQQVLESLSLPSSPSVDADKLRAGFERLRKKPVVFGVATGRPKQEAIEALESLGLLSFFAPDALVTYDDVIAAEKETRQPSLGKPHPYCLLQAAYPCTKAVELCAPVFMNQKRSWLIYVGDAGSDLLAARAAGAVPHMVLTGCASPTFVARRRQQFLELGAAGVHDNVLDFFNRLENMIA